MCYTNNFVCLQIISFVAQINFITINGQAILSGKKDEGNNQRTILLQRISMHCVQMFENNCQPSGGINCESFGCLSISDW